MLPWSVAVLGDSNKTFRFFLSGISEVARHMGHYTSQLRCYIRLAQCLGIATEGNTMGGRPYPFRLTYMTRTTMHKMRNHERA